MNDPVKTGFGAPVSGAWAGAENLGRFAVRAEELGYAALWTFHRLLFPIDDDAAPGGPPPGGGAAGGAGPRLAPVYRSVLDPLVSLAFAAARTSRIRLGVAVVNLPFVPPPFLAKQASTLDVLSGGRLDLGLGIGWSPEEFAASGASVARRGQRAEEYLAVLRTLWADEVSAYAGEFYQVPPSRMEPKPVQRPGPPVLLGGSVRAALERAGRLSAGWLSRSAHDLSRIGADIAVVRAAAERAGRDPAQVRIVVRGVVSAGTPVIGPDGRRKPLTGSYEQIRADTAWLGEQGVTEVFYDLNWDPLIGSPEVQPAAAVARATEILEALAPHSR